MNNITKTNFDPFLRLSVGMDNMFRDMEALSLKSTYPPHDIIKVSETQYVIQIAIAGFKKDDIEITESDGYLTVATSKGGTEEKTFGDGDFEYIYRGIASRAFSKSFRIADGVKVTGASMTDGILSISLEKIPESNKVKVIKIS